MTHCADNRGRQCLVEGCHGQPLTSLVSQRPRLEPTLEQFLSEKRIALTLPVQERTGLWAERSTEPLAGKDVDLVSRERTDGDRC